MNQFPPGPWVTYLDSLEFFKKFAEIFANEVRNLVSDSPLAVYLKLMYIFWFSQTSIETFFINVLLRQMFFSFYMYVFLLQKLIQREHKRFEEQPSNPAHLWKYVVTWSLNTVRWDSSGRRILCCAPPRRRGFLRKKCNHSIYKVVKSADWHCNTAPRPRFSPSILRHRGIWGVADKAVLNKIWINVHFL